MTKKPRYTVEEIRKALEESNGLISPAARALKCDYKTVKNYIARHPKLAQVQEEQREAFIDHAENMLGKKIADGDTTAIIFALKDSGQEAWLCRA